MKKLLSSLTVMMALFLTVPTQGTKDMQPLAKIAKNVIKEKGYRAVVRFADPLVKETHTQKLYNLQTDLAGLNQQLSEVKALKLEVAKQQIPSIQIAETEAEKILPKPQKPKKKGWFSGWFS